MNIEVDEGPVAEVVSTTSGIKIEQKYVADL